MKKSNNVRINIRKKYSNRKRLLEQYTKIHLTWKDFTSEACKFVRGGNGCAVGGNVVIPGLKVVAASVGQPVKADESNVS